jgi:hypothetical protein
LLSSYASILAELRQRGVVRSANAPAGDYAEWLCSRALGGTLVDNFSVKSHDLVLADARRVQVKARVTSEPPKANSKPLLSARGTSTSLLSCCSVTTTTRFGEPSSFLWK